MPVLYVYTTYTLFFMALLVACVVTAALLGTYLSLKAKKDVIFFAYLLIHAALLLMVLAKLLELVSPLRTTADAYLAFENAAVRGAVPALSAFPAVLWRCGKNRRLALLSLVFAAGAAGSLACIPLQTPKWTADGAPAAALLLFSAFVFFWRKDIFPALSELSIDTFMDKIEDAVLIFDRSRKLIDRNRKAQAMFPSLGPASTAGDLFRCIASRAAGALPPLSLEDGAPPVEFGLREGAGTSWYRFRAAAVRQKNGGRVATVAALHDVTERTVLLRALEDKNRTLQALNADLERYLGITCLLESEEEKERSWAVIREKIGKSIAQLLSDLEALEARMDVRDEAAAERLDEMIQSCRTVMSSIRQAVEQGADAAGAEEKGVTS